MPSFEQYFRFPSEPRETEQQPPPPSASSSQRVNFLALNRERLAAQEALDAVDDVLRRAAIERYDKFLRLMGTHGYRQHFYVPSYDVDLCWHTHMLASSCAYHEETRVRAEGLVKIIERV